jgi:hypothetical protein
MAKNRNVLYIALIIAFSIAVYFNALFDGFVYDDGTQVLTNNWITNIKYVPDIFTSSVAGFDKTLGTVTPNYFRPVMYLFYMLNYYLFGLSPWGFHLTNIIIHAGVSVLVFFIVTFFMGKSEFAPSGSSAFLATMLFVAHPVHTEAVTWVASLPELLFSFLSLLAFFLYIRSRDTFNFRYIVSVILFFLSTLCKETALMLPVILFAYDHGFNRKRKMLYGYLKRYSPYFIAVGCYLVMRVNALGSFAPSNNHPELTGYQYFINIFPLFAQYLEKLILPLDLNVFHTLHPISSILELKGALSLLVTAAFIATAVRMEKQNRIVFLGLLFIAVPLLPVLYIPGVGENAFAERYLYFPSIGFIIILAVVIARAMIVLPKGGIVVTLLCLFVVAAYSVGTIERNKTWANDYLLFSDAVKKSPDAAIPQGMLGYALAQRQQTDEAIKHYNIALSLNPYNPITHNNLGSAYAEKGLFDKAIEEYETSLKLNPTYADTYYNLGMAYFLQGRIDLALEQLSVAVKLNPSDPDYRDKLYYVSKFKIAN